MAEHSKADKTGQTYTRSSRNGIQPSDRQTATLDRLERKLYDPTPNRKSLGNPYKRT